MLFPTQKNKRHLRLTRYLLCLVRNIFLYLPLLISIRNNNFNRFDLIVSNEMISCINILHALSCIVQHSKQPLSLFKYSIEMFHLNFIAIKLLQLGIIRGKYTYKYFRFPVRYVI